MADVLRLGKNSSDVKAYAWLRRQGLAAGFDFNERDVRVDGYQPLTIRGDGKSEAQAQYHRI